MNTNLDRRSEHERALLRHVSFALTDVLVRTPGESGGDWFTFTGHAAVFDTKTELFRCQQFAVTETIARGAFSDVLANGEDTFLNLNHDMNFVMARTGINGVGGLELTEDETGLRVHAKLDPTISYVSDLAKLIRSGVVDQMSFAFRPDKFDVRTEVGEDGFETDHITQNSVARLFDVCACPMGAYPTTDASVRELVEMRAKARNLTRVASPETDGLGTYETVAEIPGSDASVEPQAGTEERINARKLEVKKILARLPKETTNGH